MSRDDIDTERVAVVGVRMGGGHALGVAARDGRVVACASVAGGYDLGGTFQQNMGAEGSADYLRLANEARDRGRRSGETVYRSTIAQELTEDEPLAAMPLPEPYSSYAHLPRRGPELVVADDRRLARALRHFQRELAGTSRRPDTAADRPRHDRRRAPAGERGRLSTPPRSPRS